MLLAKYTLVNGPLAQYYRSTAPASCCQRERPFGMTDESEPLLDPAKVPTIAFSRTATMPWLGFVPNEAMQRRAF